MTSMTLEAVKPTGAKPRDAERQQELLRPGPGCRGCTPARSSPPWSGSSTASASSRWWRRPTSWPSKAGYHFGETAELFETHYEVKPRPSAAGDLHKHLGQPPRWRGHRAADSWPSCPSSSAAIHHAGFGHPPRALQAQELRVRHHAGRGRDRRGRRGPGRRLRRPPRLHHHQRTRRRPQGRDHRPGRQPRVAAGGHRAFSGAAPRPGCRPRPSRPTCCWPCTGVMARPRCRSSQPGPRATASFAVIEAVRIALKYRTPVIPAVGRVPGQRGRAVAAAEDRGPARHRGGLRRPAQSHHRRRGRGVLAVPARPRHPGPALGHPR